MLLADSQRGLKFTRAQLGLVLDVEIDKDTTYILQILSLVLEYDIQNIEGY